MLPAARGTRQSRSCPRWLGPAAVERPAIVPISPAATATSPRMDVNEVRKEEQREQADDRVEEDHDGGPGRVGEDVDERADDEIDVRDAHAQRCEDDAAQRGRARLAARSRHAAAG